MKKTISIEAIKALREETSASINDCRLALESADGDPAKAREFLRQRGAQVAAKRQDRSTGQGRVESYIHHDGRLGALVEVNCETDFVARTPEFATFCREVAMQVAATNPQYVRKEDVPPGVAADATALKTSCLLEQPSVRDSGTTINELLQGLIAKTGERVVVRRFVRFSVGEAVESTS